MRAQIQEVKEGQTTSPILIVSNQLEPVFVEIKIAHKKYKKVSKAARSRLLKCYGQGWSIINVSKKFGMNYSTAKSIVQNHKKKMINGDVVGNSTQSNQDQEYLSL